MEMQEILQEIIDGIKIYQKANKLNQELIDRKIKDLEKYLWVDRYERSFGKKDDEDKS